jgi:hypothetical protein
VCLTDNNLALLLMLQHSGMANTKVKYCTGHRKEREEEERGEEEKKKKEETGLRTACNKICMYVLCIYEHTHTHTHKVPQILQKSRSHLQILGTRRVTRNNFHTANPQLWSDL